MFSLYISIRDSIVYCRKSLIGVPGSRFLPIYVFFTKAHMDSRSLLKIDLYVLKLDTTQK